MSLIVLFGITYRFHCTISVNFYLYLQYFQQKVFSFSKISGLQIDLSVFSKISGIQTHPNELVSKVFMSTMSLRLDINSVEHAEGRRKIGQRKHRDIRPSEEKI